ncbi:ras-related protein Rab-10-like isoform X1 [Hyla sarda]|uniref:ras-related protein Rab-10-like isoform X1 n=1 Tax=Hyla sarda TaxID=327740 RepID=UPI0024C2E5D8|nr:ras-related protein Rab-10-like isoform X1 [Hyla sarda]
MGGVCPPWDFQEEQGISMRKLRLPEVMADSIYNNLVAKLVMTGDSDVGKTCILSRYTDNTMPSYLSTVGIDFKTKTILFDDIPLKLQIWDTAGQERFHTLSVSYFRGAHGFILVYDITNSISFENTSLWMKDIKMKAGEEVEVVLLGNKSDREDEREVSKERGEKLAWEYGIPFFETSAKENINIENAFDLLSTTIYAKRSSVLIHQNVVNLREPKKSSSCISCT